jgi:hypothetical protein
MTLGLQKCQLPPKQKMRDRVQARVALAKIFEFPAKKVTTSSKGRIEKPSVETWMLYFHVALANLFR